MEKTMTQKKVINEAIWTVLKAKYKKEAKEAFKVVEDAGYEIYKNGCGYWTVSNPDTHRYINLGDRGWKHHSYTVIQHGPYVAQSRMVQSKEFNSNSIAFDFVNCLDTPINETWYKLQNKSNTSKAVAQYQAIKFSKRMAESYARDIENTMKEIERLQARLISQTESKVRYEAEVKELKRQFGL